MSSRYCIFTSYIIIHLANACDTSCTTYLSNSDFDEGTFRITSSGVYCLTEDIIFNPHPHPISAPNENFGWFPTDDDKYAGCNSLSGGAYSLGYFAAITIETDDIEVNLCGFQISQSQHFNIQQRWFNIIEIAKAPFEAGYGPTDFGGLQSVHNIFIHNGKLGLSSHNSIHSNSARNVHLKDLKVFDFEVGGIQFNGAHKIRMENLEIGPSNNNVKTTAYYSNAKFVSVAMRNLLDTIDYNPNKEYITYSDGRRLSLQRIYKNLITSMDIAFRYFLDANTKNDFRSDLYQISVDLYHNKFGLPDGSALYGIVLNSFSFAVFGLGQERNNYGDGQDIVIENVVIRDLKLRTNEVINMYFDECTDKETDTKTFIKGPFGDTIDIRHMVQKEYMSVIDAGGDITKLKYKGNPLDDARIALALFGAPYNLQYVSVSIDNDHFFAWALDEYNGVSLNTLPSCASYICNGDIMFHQNKGIMAFRADLIDQLIVQNMNIRKLMNKSPLSSFACGAYDGPQDGGHPTQMEAYGGLSASVKGMSIYGGDLLFKGKNVIANMKSNNGDVVGMHLFHDAMVLFEQEARIKIHNMDACKNLDKYEINRMIKQGKYPYPNNCFVCNILQDPVDNNGILLDPNPPNGVNQEEEALYCKDVNENIVHLPTARTKYEPRKKKLYFIHAYDEEYRNLNWDPHYKCNKLGNK